jgi:hypothetical protein
LSPPEFEAGFTAVAATCASAGRGHAQAQTSAKAQAAPNHLRILALRLCMFFNPTLKARNARTSRDKQQVSRKNKKTQLELAF